MILLKVFALLLCAAQGWAVFTSKARNLASVPRGTKFPRQETDGLQNIVSVLHFEQVGRT